VVKRERQKRGSLGNATTPRQTISPPSSSHGPPSSVAGHSVDQRAKARFTSNEMHAKQQRTLLINIVAFWPSHRLRQLRPLYLLRAFLRHLRSLRRKSTARACVTPIAINQALLA